MIQKEDLIPIGQVRKPHGIHGEMSIEFTSDVFDRVEVPYFIFEMDGIPVPFFLKEYRMKTAETALIQLEDINNEENARRFAGLTIYLPKEYLDEVEDTEIDLDYFAGFTLIDENAGEIGLIAEVDQTTENALFVIEKDNDELLIPVGDDYIVEIDHAGKRIIVCLPEGLLEL